MKVLVVNNMAPFVWGGAEELAKNLQQNLVVAGHEAEILRIPFQHDPANQIISQMLMVRAFELHNVDHVIALKFPAYIIRHPRKSLWLLHQYRQAYDLFDSDHTNLPRDQKGLALRNMIRSADNQTFSESRYIYTISQVTADRLKKYNNFDAEILLPPLNNPHLFEGGEPMGYIFAGGRINGMKRQHLLIEAMRKTNARVKLLIAGPPDSKSDADRLIKMVASYGLADRVKLDLKFLSRENYADYVNRSLAVAYLPFDEDSLGYVTMEAATAAKALITTTDSGGVLGLVRDKETGWLSEPDAQSLATAMDSVFVNLAVTKKYGEAAKELWDSLGVNWHNVTEKLLR